MDTKELLQVRLQELIAEKAALKARTAKLREEREALIVVANEANARVQALTEQIHAIERPRMLELLRETAGVAAGLNGLRMGG